MLFYNIYVYEEHFHLNSREAIKKGALFDIEKTTR